MTFHSSIKITNCNVLTMPHKYFSDKPSRMLSGMLDASAAVTELVPFSIDWTVAVALWGS